MHPSGWPQYGDEFSYRVRIGFNARFCVGICQKWCYGWDGLLCCEQASSLQEPVWRGNRWTIVKDKIFYFGAYEACGLRKDKSLLVSFLRRREEWDLVLPHRNQCEPLRIDGSAARESKFRYRSVVRSSVRVQLYLSC